jgi:GMP synthase (glutamine-hydrolysing)
MKPFLIIQLRPEDVASDGEFEAILAHGKLRPEEVVRLRIEETGIPEDLDPHAYAGIIVGGSPFDISTPAEAKSEMQNKIEAGFHHLFQTVVPDDIPFLGCCSGNGLLGSYCGATISTTYNEPVAPTDITFTKAGRMDPLVAGLPETIRVLAGHKEGCDDVPPGSVLLASNDACPVHMFRVGENVYATQFHPEADPSRIADRIEVYKNHGYFPPEDAEKLIANLEMTPHANLILERFVARYRAT